MNEKLINRNPATRLLVLTIPSGSAETEAVPLSRGTIPDPAPSGRASTHALRYLQPVPGLSGTNIKLHAGISQDSMQVLKRDGEEVELEGGELIEYELTHGLPYIKFVASENQSAERKVRIVDIG